MHQPARMRRLTTRGHSRERAGRWWLFLLRRQAQRRLRHAECTGGRSRGQLLARKDWGRASLRVFISCAVGRSTLALNGGLERQCSRSRDTWRTLVRGGRLFLSGGSGCQVLCAHAPQRQSLVCRCAVFGVEHQCASPIAPPYWYRRAVHSVGRTVHFAGRTVHIGGPSSAFPSVPSPSLLLRTSVLSLTRCRSACMCAHGAFNLLRCNTLRLGPFCIIVPPSLTSLTTIL